MSDHSSDPTVQIANPDVKPLTKFKTTEVSPVDVVLFGGLVVAAAVTWQDLLRSLVEDGINPATRMQMIPLAARALMLSTVLTGCLGVAGFFALKSVGFFSTDRAELPTVQEAARLLRDPKSFIREFVAEGRKDTQGAAPAAATTSAASAAGQPAPSPSAAANR